MDYIAKTQVFEGPLELLLELVSARKLFINDVSLAQVTDDFIRYIEAHEQFPLSESAEFILVASTLMLIKSRSLLPQLPLTTEEEQNIHDLENRLIEYAKVKELAQKLKEIYGRQVIFEKEGRKNQLVVFAPDSKTNVTDLSLALSQLIMTLPKAEALPKVVVKKVISLEEMITRLSERISKASRMSFKDLHGVKGAISHENKISIIVGFLAMLELVKRGAIRATQEAHDSEIEIERESLNTPTYA